MVKINKKIFGASVLLVILLILLPSCYALENNTDDNTADVHVISSSNDDLNPVGIDYYFNSSNENDGDGSFENPYKNLTSGRLKTGSTIHLANGEYNLTSGKSLNKMSIIGETPEMTIVRYVGYGDAGQFSINIDNYLILENVTFIGFNFDIEGANLQATNTIFKNSVGFTSYSSATNLVNSASNSFGGAIYAYSYTDSYDSYEPTIVLDNCTFINNTAEYGGAIFLKGGALDITNSTFIDNYAYNYGGAIAVIDDVVLKVKSSKFVNDYSINDAGGAVYLLKSSLSANNVSVINCSSTFGPAITSLNSTTAVYRLNAVNNTAKYEGGAVFHMYNAIQVTDSNFSYNSARNGGAIYVDDAEIFTLKYNNFENNEAEDTAGAVYSILNSIVSVENNNYSENKAKKCEDYYQSDRAILTIGDGNFTLYFNNYTSDGNLPSYYSLVNEGFVTGIRDQQSGGNCWAFGALAALESAILKASGDNLDLSEENIKNLMQTFSDYGWRGIETNDGGFDEMAIAYLISWLGPVNESEDEYDDYSMLSPVIKSITHVQNIQFLTRNNYTDNNAIKEAIMRYGAVSTGIYYDSTYFYNSRNSYYYYGSSYANHAVAIVGWDDNYSSTNFYNKPAGDGAWIVKNSWGESWGNKGYFYVSYYDTRLAQIGVPDYSYVFVFNDTEKYDKNYQYDIAGKTDYMVTENKTVWVENIFKATDNELLSAVSSYFRKTTDYELFIYVNNHLALVQNGTFNPGYTTVKLDNNISLASGDEFKVMFKLSCNESTVEFPISEKLTSNVFNGIPGVSLFSLDGLNWTDLYDFEYSTERDGGHAYDSQVAVIKAFTILYELQPFIELNVSNIYNNANVTASIHDQYGNRIHSGEVIFSLDGKNYTCEIENSVASLSHIFEKVGNYTITASYRNANQSVSLDINKIFLDLEFYVNIDRNNFSLNLTSLYNVNTTLGFNVNGKNYSSDMIGGVARFNLDDLDYGIYNASADVMDDVYVNHVDFQFNITISKTKLIADEFTVYYNSEKSYSFALMDIYNNPVANRPISIIFNGKSYFATTNSKGIASIDIKLDKIGDYTMNIIFYGDESYFVANTTSLIKVKSTISVLGSDLYLTGSKLTAVLLDSNGNPLSKNQINLVIDKVNYWLISDGDGVVSTTLNIKTGNHVLMITNPETGEVVYKEFTLNSRIMGNKNINMYFGAGNVYKIRVYGNDAKPVGAGEVVKITIAGKSHNVRTDKNGYASFKINLASKTYTITATYKGYKVSNKIVVKPVLTAKNISKKKAKTIKFTAKLVNTKGKALKGKVISFKLKGKTYKIKTNKKGIATLSLKNLKDGKYTIKTTYGKSTIKNTIKIRK